MTEWGVESCSTLKLISWLYKSNLQWVRHVERLLGDRWPSDRETCVCRPVTEWKCSRWPGGSWGSPEAAAERTCWWNDVMLFCACSRKGEKTDGWTHIWRSPSKPFYLTIPVVVHVCVGLSVWRVLLFYFPPAQPLAPWVAHPCVRQGNERHFDLDYFEISLFDWTYFQKCGLFFDRGLVSDIERVLNIFVFFDLYNICVSVGVGNAREHGDWK